MLLNVAVNTRNGTRKIKTTLCLAERPSSILPLQPTVLSTVEFLFNTCLNKKVSTPQSICHNLWRSFFTESQQLCTGNKWYFLQYHFGSKSKPQCTCIGHLRWSLGHLMSEFCGSGWSLMFDHFTNEMYIVGHQKSIRST